MCAWAQFNNNTSVSLYSFFPLLCIIYAFLHIICASALESTFMREWHVYGALNLMYPFCATISWLRCNLEPILVLSCWFELQYIYKYNCYDYCYYCIWFSCIRKGEREADRHDRKVCLLAEFLFLNCFRGVIHANVQEVSDFTGKVLDLLISSCLDILLLSPFFIFLCITSYISGDHQYW